MKQHILALSMALAAGISTAPQAQAEPWEYTGFVYAWGSSLGGSTVTGQDFEMSFSEVVENLDFAIMGALEARSGKLSLLGDLQFLNVSEGKNAAFGPGIPASADARLKGLVFTGSVGYDLQETATTRLTGFGGVRTMNLDTTANIAVGGGSQRITSRSTNWDAIVGLRGRSQVSDRWALTYYGDIGAGESDLTWQAAVSADYQINNWELSVGYRHMTWDIGNSPVLSSMTLSGPFIGAKFRF